MTAIDNKRAHFDYQILEEIEAGIELFGFEVKGVKDGKASLKGVYATVKDGEIFLINCDISPYQIENAPQNYDSKRSRKLLLHKSEISHLIGKIKERGLTLVPLKMYNKKGKIKILLGLAKSKKKFDKREQIKKKEAKRDIERNLKRK